MPLSDTKIRSAKPRERAYKLYDAGGLFVLVTPSASRLWRYRYRLFGKEKLLALGAYPEISLSKAREKAAEARSLVANDTDPVLAKASAKAAAKRTADSTFAAIAAAWRDERTWTPATRKQYDRLFDRDILPALGRKPVDQIGVQDVRALFDQTAKLRGVVAARHVRLLVAGVLARAEEDELIARNPTDKLKSRSRSKSRTMDHTPTPFRHVTADVLRETYRKLDDYKGAPETIVALRLLSLCFTRPTEMRAAEWSEFDLDAATPIWRIPAERMKARRPHDVPLSTQAIALLRELRGFSAGRFLFPNTRDRNRPMGVSTLLRALEYLGVDSSPHGFRHAASSKLHELGFDSLVIERQLAHKDRDKTRAAYNRTDYLTERRRMLQAWANFITGDTATTPNVVPLRKSAS